MLIYLSNAFLKVRPENFQPLKTKEVKRDYIIITTPLLNANRMRFRKIVSGAQGNRCAAGTDSL